MPDRTVVQWDKESLEDAGIIKIDVLGLKMLSAITEMVERTGVDADMIPFDDPPVYQMITQAKTFGVFQCESRAQMNTLPRLKPTRFLDLIIAISLIRRDRSWAIWCILICGAGAAQKRSAISMAV